VIHRDIKPNNLIVNQDGILKLLDFGIAQLHGASGISTATGQVLATYAYAPPEQNQGKEIDRTADLYSMGALAWEMLVGRRFITGNSPPQVVLQQTMGPPPPPSEQVPGLTEAFDQVVRKLCMPYPEDRYRSASELAQALRTLRRSFQGREELLTFYGDEAHEKWIMAKSAYYNGQHSLAASLAQYITRQQDDFAPAHFLLGKLYAERGLAVNASDSFRRAIELSPRNEDYQLDFALALFRMGRNSEAQRELLRLLSSNPHNQLAAGFYDVVLEAVLEQKAAELADADPLEEAPLWLEDGPRPAEEIPERATPPGEDPSRISSPSRPGTLTGDGPRVAGAPVFPEVDETRAREVSRLIPGIAHLQLGAPREGAALLAAAIGLVLALGFLLIAWSPQGWLDRLLRGALSLAAMAAAAQLWTRAPEDAYRRARRLNLRGGVTACPSLERVRVNLGSDRGAAPGQVFELTRGDQVLGTIVLEEVDTYSASGPFQASPVSGGAPAPGDTARFVREAR
jgi:tetratricopeptide (TPR) repeat protein